MWDSAGFLSGGCLLVFLTFVSSHYTPQWAVHIRGGQRVAEQVAAEHGFLLLGEIMPDYYHFQGRGVARRSIEPHDGHQKKLDADDRVHWAQQQRAKIRKKRDYIAQPATVVFNQAVSYNSEIAKLNDPRWYQMWYLNRGDGLDMNVIPAWEEGYTGKGVVVTILDDGLEKDHPDIIRNYDPLASYDVNNHDEDPMPRYDLIDSNRHGTRCAGEVAATANNSICAVGVAYGASVGGVRMLDGDVTDAVEARSLSLNKQHIDIYSASWGPDDDGKTVDGPGELATRAFIEGVTKGRSGKGSIFIWASGNGGRDKDNCNCDGYTNSIWTLSISSATESGHVPWYSEACSSTLATTYSSGSVGEKQIVTTDLHHSCTPSHTGTSASAPLAAGICALALEANPELTWRDMQHIVVRTAKPANLKANDWIVNGVGRNVSHSFGYGLMDASAMVRVAKTWRTVPEQQKCEISAQIIDPTIPPKSRKKFSLMVNDCPGVNYLEHVQAKISLSTLRRGDLEINLTSPAGTKSTLLEHRSHDFSRQGFVLWPFMSVHTWGESPFGEWKLEIHNEGRTLNRASLQQWSLVFYGTAIPVVKTDKYYLWPTTKKAKTKNPPKSKNKKQKATPVLKGVSKPKIYKPGIESTQRPKQKLGAAILQKYSKAERIYPALYPKVGVTPWEEVPKVAKNSESSRDVRKGKEKIQKSIGSQREKLVTTEMTTTLSHDGAASELTDWQMIFHGTTSLPTIDTKPPVDVDLNTKTGIGEIQANDLDQNVDATSNDRWRDEAPQIGEDVNHINLQQASDDSNSTACTKSNGRLCLDCMDGYYLLRGKNSAICVTECPSRYFALTTLPKRRKVITDQVHTPSAICQECHHSCLFCNGINDYDCTQCFPDDVLTNVSSKEHYCYPASVAKDISETKWLYRTYAILLLILISILVFVISVGVLYLCHKLSVRRQATSSLYSKLRMNDLDMGMKKELMDSDSE